VRACADKNYTATAAAQSTARSVGRATEDQTPHCEGAKAQALLRMKREHRHRQTDDEVRHEYRGHDRQWLLA